MVIDSYSEYILNPKQNNAVGVLPKGESREAFLFKLDILIKETLPEMTPYSEKEFRSGKALLLLIKKYCLNDKAFGNVPQASDFSAYLDITKKMLEDEIKRMSPVNNGEIPAVDFNVAFTIVSNAMQLLTSAMDYRKEQTEKNKKNNQPVFLGIKLPVGGNSPVPQMSFARESTEIGDVINYLDDTWTITRNYMKAKGLMKAQGEAFIEWNEFKYLKLILQITKMRLDEIGVF